jgi:EmrB/QacA subfamily drug resistance transporter
VTARNAQEEGFVSQSSRLDRRGWITLMVVCMSLLIITIDNTILNVALPTIVRDLGANGSELQWIIDGYLLVFAGLLLTAGSIGDKVGRKPMLLGGLAAFGVFSALASLSTSPEMLIAARALMGAAAACIYPTTLSILTNTFQGQQRARAIGIWAGMSGLGVAIGPLAGGFLVEHFSWAAVFLVNVPICIASVFLGLRFVSNSRDPDDRPLDLVGALLSIFALCSVLYAIIHAPSAGWTSSTVLVTFGLGCIGLVLFAWWERQTAEPMLDLDFFRNPRFSAASATITLVTFALVGSTYLLTQYFQFVLDYSPLEAGALAVPVAVGMMAISPNTPRLVARWGTKRVVTSGVLIVAVGLLFYASDAIMSAYVGGALVRLLFGVGIGMCLAPATDSIMGSIPRARAGVGSAVNDTTRQTGGALGVAVLGSIFASRYRSSVSGLHGLSRETVSAAHDSIGRALDVGRHLPQAQLRLVDHAARAAFIDAMRFTYPIAAMIVAIAAVVAWRYLPSAAADDGASLEPQPSELALGAAIGPA